MKKTALFYIVVLLCLLPAILLRDYTPSNELRYLSIADEALRQHHLFTFTNHGALYADKPPLYLWLVMAVRCCPLWSQHMLFGLLSVVPAFLTTEVMARLLRFKGNSLWLFRMLMTTSALWLVTMLTLRMDMLMTLFIVLSIYEFYRLYSSGRPHESPLLPLWLFLGVFTKGAVGFIVPFSVIVVFLCVKGQGGSLFRYLGWKSWLMLILLFSLWFGAVYAEGGSGYLYNLAVHQTLGRAFHSFHHRQPIYYYLYMYWPLLMPWSLWSALAAWRLWRSKSYGNNRVRLALIAMLVTFLCLSLISSKLSIYLLPLVPFAIAMIPLVPQTGNKAEMWALGIPSFLLALTLPAFIVANHYWTPMKSFASLPLIMAVLAITVCAVAAFVMTVRHRLQHAAMVLAGGILLTTYFAGWSMPQINPYLGYQQLCRKVSIMLSDYPGYPLIAVDMKRAANMDVYLNRSPRLISSNDSISIPRHAIVVMPQRDTTIVKLQEERHVGQYIVGRK
ncbi:MAG: ArnT family glycosyltransferase [Prevotella sp.]|jgi:4-amino-4-deoxy-L-arabinose transferase-like glycosyltransferase